MGVVDDIGDDNVSDGTWGKSLRVFGQFLRKECRHRAGTTRRPAKPSGWNSSAHRIIDDR